MVRNLIKDTRLWGFHWKAAAVNNKKYIRNKIRQKHQMYFIESRTSTWSCHFWIVITALSRVRGDQTTCCDEEVRSSRHQILWFVVVLVCGSQLNEQLLWYYTQTGNLQSPFHSCIKKHVSQKKHKKVCLAVFPPRPFLLYKWFRWFGKKKRKQQESA